MTTVTTKSFQLSTEGLVNGSTRSPTQFLPDNEAFKKFPGNFPAMDLDTIEGVSTLDHSPQKGRSELAHKGSLGHRRPPTRAGLRALVSSVWSEDNVSHISEEPRDPAQQSAETEESSSPASGWKHPPKHAVLVFPMQLLNANKLRHPSSSPEPSTSPVIQFEDENENRISGDDEYEIHRQSNKTTTVKIRPSSDPDSDPLEDDMNSRNLSKRHSGPTIVSITLKDPLSRTSSLDETNNAKNSILHSNDSDLDSMSGGSMVITIGDLSPTRMAPSCQDTGTQMYGTLRGSKKKKQRPSSPVARNSEGPTQILIRPYNRTDITHEEEELPTEFDRRSSKSCETSSSLVYIKSPSSPVGRPHSFDGGGWRRNDNEDSKENFDSGLKRITEHRSPGTSSITSRESSKDVSPERSSGSAQRNSRRDGHNRVQIQTWDRRSQPQAASPSPSRIRELVLQPLPKSRTSENGSSPRPASIIGDGGEVDRYQQLRESCAPSSRRSSPTGERYTRSSLHSASAFRSVLGERENKPEWLRKIDLNKRKVIDWENLGNQRSPTESKCPDSRLDRSYDSVPEGRYYSEYTGFTSDRLVDRSAESMPCLALQNSRTQEVLKEESAEEDETDPTQDSLPYREPEWVKIAQRRKQNSLINWESIAALRKDPEQVPRRGSLDDVQDPSNNVGVQVNLRRNLSTKGRSEISSNQNSGRERRTTSAERNSRNSGKNEPTPKKKESLEDNVHNILSKVKASQGPKETTGRDKVARGQHGSSTLNRRGRSSSPPPTRWAHKEVVIEDLPTANDASKRRSSGGGTRLNSSKEHQSRSTWKEFDPARVSIGKPKCSPPSREAVKSPPSDPVRFSRPCRSTNEHQEPSWQHQQMASSATPWLQQELTVDVGSGTSSGSEYEDGSSAQPSSKKKVRFMISTEDGQKKKVLSITPTTYTMFGMDNNSNSGKSKVNPKSETTCPDAESTLTSGEKRLGKAEGERVDATLPTGGEDYELQAYKIINRIKQMTKEKDPESRTKDRKDTSPSRPPSGRTLRENSPDHGPHDTSHRKAASSGRADRGHHKRRSQPSQRSHTSNAARGGHLGRDESPASSSDSAAHELATENNNAKPNRKTPEWMKKALHKQKSPVDWESLEKGPASGPDKPMWAGVKLKKTPFSTKFLSIENLTDSYEDGYDSESFQDPVLNEVYRQDEKGDEGFAYNGGNDCLNISESSPKFERAVQEPLVMVAKQTDRHFGQKRSKTESDSAESSSNHVSPIPSTDNQVIISRTPAITACMINDSEGYSSMESSLSNQQQRLQARPGSASSCVHCGRAQDDWSPVSSPNTSPLPSVVTNGTTQKNDNPTKPVVVDIISKPQNGQPECVGKECAFPRMLRVVDNPSRNHQEVDQQTHPEVDNNKNVEQNGLIEPGFNGYHSDDDNVSKEQPQIPNDNYVFLDGCEEKCKTKEQQGQDEDNKGKAPVPPARLRRRQSLLDKRQKLLDLLTSKSVKRGPQVKTIKKTIRRILRGSELTDEEEEEIVEEITEEVFGIPVRVKQPESKNGSVTRTVHQTKDGRHFLTTTYVHDQLDGKESGPKILNVVHN